MLLSPISLIFFAITVGIAGRNCSTWHYLSEDDHCVCGNTLEDVVVCNDTLGVVGVLEYYCLTSDGDQSVVGQCIVVDSHRERLLSPLGHYKKVFPTLSEEDSYTCGFLNRHGRLCGQCKPNTSLHAYTYDMKCYPCFSKIWIEIMKYIGIAYLPLTVFLVVVVVFHISVTSPAMNVPVLCCQLLSMPFALRLIWQYSLKYPHIRSFVMIFDTIYGIWNLDFFRLVIPPICLKLDVMKLIALDYLVAVYPLLLLVCFYVLVTAHDRGCRLVVRLWRPFLWCSARVRKQWSVQHSIIDAFATFLLLSYIKFIDISFDLLIYITAYNEKGGYVGRYLYNNPTVEFMSHQHVPYAITAIVVLVGLLVPLLLLILYPMEWFQVFLNKYHLNSPGLRMFMECFQGYYRDRSDGGWECRYFAVVYLVIRILTYVIYNVFNWFMFFVVCIVLYIGVIGLIILVQPYKSPYKSYHKLDIMMLLSFVFFLLGLIVLSSHDPPKRGATIAKVFTFLSTLTPIIFFILKVSINLKDICFCRKKKFRELADSQLSSLLRSRT